MSFLYPPTFVAEIDAAIQQGRGAAAAVLGQQYNVFRLGPTTNGSITNGTPIDTGFPARIRPAKKHMMEGATFDLVMFEAICDNRSLKLGDVLLETKYESTNSYYTVVQMRPTRETLLARTESTINIVRPIPDGGRASQQPASGAIATPGYGGVYKGHDFILTLMNGLYSFVDPALNPTPAVVPVGLQPAKGRVKDASHPSEMQVRHYRDEFWIFAPLIPGDALQEKDVLMFGQSDRYVVKSLYTASKTGVVGTVALTEKLA